MHQRHRHRSRRSSGSARVISLILGVCHILVGLIAFLGALGSQMRPGENSSATMMLFGLAAFGFCPLVVGTILIFGRHSGGRIAGLMYLEITAMVALIYVSGRIHAPAGVIFPWWNGLLFFVMCVVLPAWIGIQTLRKNYTLGQVIGLFLIQIGIWMFTGFVILRSSGESPRSFWADLLAAVLVGILPIAMGVLTFRQRQAQLERMVMWICLGCVGAFIASSATYFIFPQQISDQFMIVAGFSLIGTVISAVAWITLFIMRRTKRDFSGAAEMSVE